jgi:serine/threonine-protein kinase
MPPKQSDSAVTTDCLRAGDRCMSYLHGSAGATPLVFSAGSWILDAEYDGKCPDGNPTRLKRTGQFALPAPPQNPIAVLGGRGQQVQNAPCAFTLDFDETYTRTGD